MNGLMYCLPDDFLLKKILTRHLYFDKKSKEESTGIVKGKYKLAGINEDILTNAIQVYRFFVGTSEETSCQKELTLKTHPSHWEDLDPSYKNTIGSLCGYFDVRNIEVLNRSELIEKMRDGSNGFPLVAKLKYQFFGDLQRIALNLDRAHKPISKIKIPHILKALIKKSDNADMIMRNLGL
jgi:hypothetical protein